jgi:hypothetical protein
MKVVHPLVPPDGVHVGVKPLAGRKPVAEKGHAFPLRQRLDNLGVFPGFRHVELHRAFDPVQVVVKPGPGIHEQRGRNTLDAEGSGQAFLEGFLHHADRGLCFVKRQRGTVAIGDEQL